MKREKGFTLIELLAVIIILSVIMVIAVPKVLDVINKSKEEAFIDSAYGISDSAKYYYFENNMTDSYNFEYENRKLKNNEELKYKGTNPDSGNLVISSKGKIKLAFYSDSLNLCIKKDFNDKKIKKVTGVTKDKCNTNMINEGSTWFWVNINDENELKYVTNKELREKVIDLFSENGINKIYIVIPSGYLQSTFKDFVVYANSKDIKVYNLIGDPTSIKEDGYERTINTYYDEIKSFNDKMSENGINARVEGVHYDVEFYGNGNEDFGYGKWIGGQSEEAKNCKRRLAYINFAKATYKYASKLGLEVEFDVPNILSKLTYYDEDNNEKNMLEEVLKNSDNVTIMYYVTMKKYITTDNALIYTGSYTFSVDDDENRSTVDVKESMVEMINRYHSSYNIGTDLSFFRQDDTKMKECTTSFKNELKPYIDSDLIYDLDYMNNYYKTQIDNIKNYQNSKNLSADVKIAYHDAWELMYLLGIKDTEVMNKRISNFANNLKNNTNCYN